MQNFNFSKILFYPYGTKAKFTTKAGVEDKSTSDTVDKIAVVAYLSIRTAYKGGIGV